MNMDLWRSNCDYSVLQNLQLHKRQEKTHYLTDGYEVMLEQDTVRTLLESQVQSVSRRDHFQCSNICQIPSRREEDPGLFTEGRSR